MYIDKATFGSTITDVDNGGSDIRITAPSHGLTTGDTVLIAGVGGTTEANGTFTVTVIDASKFTLDGTTYTNAYTGGGGVYTGWRLQLSLGASDYDCHATLSVKKFASGAVSSIETYAFVVSTATTTLLTCDPTYAYSVEEISIVSTEASGDIVLTLQLLNKSNTAFTKATATLDAGDQLTISGGVLYMQTATGGQITPPGP